jgi:sodium pump decarboxylase gamma subunit
MNELTILQKFADPEIIKTMTMGEKLTASLYTTILGMSITFVALLFIWFMTANLSKFIMAFENKNKQTDVVSAPKVVTPAPVETVVEENDEELVAVITAAIAASLNTSMHNIVVTNIVRVNDATPAWGRAGRVDLMNTRF